MQARRDGDQGGARRVHDPSGDDGAGHVRAERLVQERCQPARQHQLRRVEDEIDRRPPPMPGGGVVAEAQRAFAEQPARADHRDRVRGRKHEDGGQVHGRSRVGLVARGDHHREVGRDPAEHDEHRHQNGVARRRPGQAEQSHRQRDRRSGQHEQVEPKQRSHRRWDALVRADRSQRHR